MKGRRNSRKWRSLALVLGVIFFAVTTSLVGCNQTTNGSSVAETQSVRNRVIEAGKIRAAYVVYPPSLIKDPNTNKISGISAETIEKAAKNLDLELEWVEEVAWGSMIEGLETNRYDLVVAGIWPSASRAKLVDFSLPLYFSPIGIYVRQNDNRFDSGNLKEINSDKIRIATIDGEISSIIAESQFPKAQRVSLPQLSDVSQLLLNVSQNKADIAFVEPYLGFEYLKNNPGTLKNAAEDRPLRVFGNTVMFNRGQTEFKSMLNITLQELINSGEINEIINKYESFPGAFYRTAPAHQQTK